MAYFKRSEKVFMVNFSFLHRTAGGLERRPGHGANPVVVLPETPLAERLVGVRGIVGGGVLDRLVVARPVVGLGVPLDRGEGGRGLPRLGLVRLVLLHFCSHSFNFSFNAR